MTDEKSDRPGVIAPPPLIFTAGLVIGLLIQRARPVRLLPGLPARRFRGKALRRIAR